MTELIATINGKQIFSDKAVLSTNNKRVEFCDGSWWDVSTGDVFNNGQGYIKIKTILATEIITETQNFSATTLVIRGVKANVNIQPYDGSDIEVVKEGLKTLVDVIKIIQDGSVVSVESNERQTGTGSSKNNRSIEIKVKVPKKTAVSIDNVYGLVRIGDTEGPVSLRMIKVNYNVQIGSVGDLEIDIEGSTGVCVKYVKGSLLAKVKGPDDIRIDGGEVVDLMVDKKGASDFCFCGKALNANLKNSGFGNIEIDYVQNKPIKNRVGVGDIKIGNWQS